MMMDVQKESNSKLSHERTLQTLAVIALLFLQVGSTICMPLLAYYLIFHTKYWLFCILYVTWYLFVDLEIPLERRSQWVRNWSWWVHVRNYYPVKLVKLPWGELNPTRNYLFCYFPHGLMCTGAFITLGTNAGRFADYFPNHRPYIHTISWFFKLPFTREIGIFLGGLTASKKSLNYSLGKPGGGNVSGLLVGGADEAFYCKPGLHKIVYKKRKGFVKIALTNGSPLVPVYCFGETDLYSQIEFEEGSYFNKFQKIVKKLTGFVTIIPSGQGFCGILPFRRPVTVVVGEPIDVQKTENPTQKQIDELHQIFQKKLMELFESQKSKYLENHQDAHLEIS
ncbi:hypothetical protein WA026_007341 [Henosepilachna vigintioctopunctata]|uniref:Acyltransferase n=1 Tax=Henosepilachna vigintioctopunctata TaxID=420089 RepID=A0AAW1UPM8_9CUCU